MVVREIATVCLPQQVVPRGRGVARVPLHSTIRVGPDSNRQPAATTTGAVAAAAVPVALVGTQRTLAVADLVVRGATENRRPSLALRCRTRVVAVVAVERPALRAVHRSQVVLGAAVAVAPVEPRPIPPEQAARRPMGLTARTLAVAAAVVPGIATHPGHKAPVVMVARESSSFAIRRFRVHQEFHR